MLVNCPNCNHAISLEQDNAQCSNGHLFPKVDNVYQLITPEYRNKVAGFLAVFPQYRNSLKAPISAEDFPRLPHVDFDTEMWRLRQMDLELILPLCSSGGKKVLDIGAWNGWLSNKLAEKGNQVLAVDLFIDSLDGLGANVHYPNHWTSFQMDLENLSILQEQFDLIIINRSISYFQDLSRLIEQVKELLSPTGSIIITGVQKIKSSAHITEHLNQTAQTFEEKFGVPFYIKEFKGFITSKEVKLLKEKGFEVQFYPKLRLQSLKAHLNPKAPSYQYAIFNKLS